MSAGFSLSICGALMLACVASASATIYKWVDERGVTNYSNRPPAESGAKKSTAVSGNLSVYTPDPDLKRATDALRARMLDDIATGRREREREAERLAREYLSAMQPTYVDPCAGNPDCGGYAPGYGYGYGIPAHFHPGGLRILPQIQLTPGTTAGNVTGSTGFIPGNSAFAPRPPLFSRHVQGFVRTPERAMSGHNGSGHPGGGHHGGGHRGR